MKPSKDDIKRDQEFRDWISYLPSCLTGRFSEYKDGVGRCIPCHVRGAYNSGIANKPLLSCVPMTDDEHRLQHQRGYLAVLRAYHPVNGIDTEHDALEWFKDQAQKYLTQWLLERGV